MPELSVDGIDMSALSAEVKDTTLMSLAYKAGGGNPVYFKGVQNAGGPQTIAGYLTMGRQEILSRWPAASRKDDKLFVRQLGKLGIEFGLGE